MIELGFRNVGFYGGRKTGEKPSKQGRESTTNSTHMKPVPEPRIESTTHWHHSNERRAYYRNTTHASQLSVF
jgi:hypothetical protein